MNKINLILTDEELNALNRSVYEINRAGAPWVNRSVFDTLLEKLDEVKEGV